VHNALRLSGDRQGSRVGGDYRKRVRRAIRCLGSDSLLLWLGATVALPPARDRPATG